MAGFYSAVDKEWLAPGFDTSAVARLRSPLSTVLAGIIVPTFPQRSLPWLLTAAACGEEYWCQTGRPPVCDDVILKDRPSGPAMKNELWMVPDLIRVGVASTSRMTAFSVLSTAE